MKKENKEINPLKPVTGWKYGRTVELSTSIGHKPIMKKVSKDLMVNKYTGEIIEIHHVTSRADPKNYESLRQTFKRLKRLIGANFSGGNAELWITLTYRDSPMTDSKRLYADFSKFIKKLRRYTKKTLIYIVVIEPQASGSLHAHVLLKTADKSRLVIPNDIITNKWGQGFTKTKRLKNSENVSAYLMAYLTNVDLNNLEGHLEPTNSLKKIVKGGRLGLYPVGMQIYRRSRNGIVPPEKYSGKKHEVQAHFKIRNSPVYYRKISFKDFEVETEYYDLIFDKLKNAKK